MSLPVPAPASGITLGGMTRVRIKVKAIAPNFLPSWPDCEITLISPDGTETPMTNVQAIKFEAEAGIDECTVTLKVTNPEIEFEGKAVIET